MPWPPHVSPSCLAVPLPIPVVPHPCRGRTRADKPGLPVGRASTRPSSCHCSLVLAVLAPLLLFVQAFGQWSQQAAGAGLLRRRLPRPGRCARRAPRKPTLDRGSSARVLWRTHGEILWFRRSRSYPSASSTWHDRSPQRGVCQAKATEAAATRSVVC
jgi:hypothetical protein